MDAGQLQSSSVRGLRANSNDAQDYWPSIRLALGKFIFALCVLLDRCGSQLLWFHGEMGASGWR